MSGSIASPFANVLYNPAAAQQAAQGYQRNQLLMDRSRQEMAATDMEYLSRAAAGLIEASGGDEAKMAEMYPGALAEVQRYGFGKNAPAAFPGADAIRRVAAMGLSAEKQAELAGVRGVREGFLSGLTGAPPAPGAPGAAPPAGGGSYTDFVVGREGTGKNPRSSATGTGQFIDSTWRSFAAANPTLFQGMTPDQVMAARSNPELGRRAIDWLAGENSKDLTAAGVQPTGQALGIAHYLGAGAAAKVMQAPDSSPVRDHVSPAAVAANPELATMTVGQLRQRYASAPNPGDGRYQVAGTGNVAPPTGRPAAVPAAPPAPAGVMSPGELPDAQEQPPGAATAPPAATPQQQAQQTPQQATGPVSRFPPPPPRLPSGLTADQTRTLYAQAQLARTPQQLAQVQALKQTYLDHNDQVERQHRADVAAEEQRASTAANQAINTRLAIQKEIREQAEFDRKQVESGRAYSGNSPEASDMNILLAGSKPGGDPSTIEYANAYARQRTQKTDSGISYERDMSMFETPTWKPRGPTDTTDPNAPGGRNYGNRPKTVGVDEVGLRKAEEGAAGLLSALETFRTASKNASTTERNMSWAGAPTALSTAWTNAALLAKGEELYKLGVLSGPDLDIIRRAIADPSTTGGRFASHETINNQIDQIKKIIEVGLNARRNYGKAPPPSTSGGDGTARPPLSSFSR